MSQIQQFLQYQEIDSQLLKLEQEVATSEEYKKFVQVKKTLTKAQERLEALEVKASELRAQLATLEDKYNDVIESLKDYETVDELVEQGADVSYYKKKVASLSADIKTLKNDINGLIEALKKVDEEYKKLRKDVMPIQTSYTDLQKAYTDLRDKKKAEGDPYRTKMMTLAKSLPADFLKKYQEKRSERLFPVICSAKGDRCTKCGTELSIRGKELLATESIVECESCHRILYVEE